MSRRNALLFIHLGALLFGLSGIFGKLVDSAPLTITVARGLFAVLALALAARLLRHGGPGLDWRRMLGLVAGGLLLGAHWLTFFMAIKLAGVGIATLGFASFPAFTVLLEGLLFRERTRPVEYAMVGLVCLGLLLVTPSSELASSATLGFAYGIASGLLLALLSLLNRAVTRDVDPIRAALWQSLTVAVVLLPFAAPDLARVAPRDWLWLGLLGVLCTGLAQSLFVASLKALAARTTAVIIALEPVYAIAIAWWLFAEQPEPRALLGGALIILASLVTSRLKDTTPPTAARPVIG